MIKVAKNPIRKALDYVAAFIDHLNTIFWDGYAEELQVGNPEEFNRQFAEFCDTYSFHN